MRSGGRPKVRSGRFLWYGADMTKIEMVEQAMQALGDASSESLAAFVEKKHGDKIEARFIPLFVASIRDRMRLEASRRERAAAPKIEVEPRV